MNHSMNPKPGDAVVVETPDKKIEGRLIQSPEKDVVIVKLDNGYNIGIDSKKVKSLKIVSEYGKTAGGKRELSKSGLDAEEAKNLPRVSILHTGGTIASKVDYNTGGTIPSFTPKDLQAMFPELSRIAVVSSKLIRNMWSQDMRFAHYNLIAKEVENEIKNGASGVVIAHGTDTLHYSSAALSFMLDNLPVPVILVGAQRSSDRGSSDAGMNLISAVFFAGNSDFSGVAVCMHENLSDSSCLILPGLKTRKMHTSRRDAFRPINSTPIARIDFPEMRISFIAKEYQRRDKARKARISFFKEDLKVGILKAHPNMYASELAAYEGFDGLVLEGTGLGQLPISEIDEFTKEHTKILDEIKKLTRKTVVVMAPQTIYGRLQMDVYEDARRLQEAGVVGNGSDMTPETSFIKLAYLLSNYKPDETKVLFTKNLKGEISDRSESGAFLI